MSHPSGRGGSGQQLGLERRPAGGTSSGGEHQTGGEPRCPGVAQTEGLRQSVAAPAPHLLPVALPAVDVGDDELVADASRVVAEPEELFGALHAAHGLVGLVEQQVDLGQHGQEPGAELEGERRRDFRLGAAAVEQCTASQRQAAGAFVLVQVGEQMRDALAETGGGALVLRVVADQFAVGPGTEVLGVAASGVAGGDGHLDLEAQGSEFDGDVSAAAVLQECVLRLVEQLQGTLSAGERVFVHAPVVELVRAGQLVLSGLQHGVTGCEVHVLSRQGGCDRLIIIQQIY